MLCDHTHGLLSCPFGIVNLYGAGGMYILGSSSPLVRLTRNSTCRGVELENESRTLAPYPWRSSHDHRFALFTLKLATPFFGISAGGCELAFYDLGFCRGIPDCQFADPEMNRAAGRV